MASPQPPKGKDQTLPVGESKKTKRVVEKNAPVLSDALPKTPFRAKGGPKIQEPASVIQPAAQVGSTVASPSQPKVGWQPNFQLGDKPLPANAIVRL